METFARIWTILGLIALSRAGDSSMNILASSPSNLDDAFEDDVLHVLSRNKTDKNFTFVDMISRQLGNYSVDAERNIWSDDVRPDTYSTNPHYGESILLREIFRRFARFARLASRSINFRVE